MRTAWAIPRALELPWAMTDRRVHAEEQGAAELLGIQGVPQDLKVLLEQQAAHLGPHPRP